MPINFKPTDYIEIAVTVDGTPIAVHCEIPEVLKYSHGVMSIKSSIKRAIEYLTEDIAQQLANLNPCEVIHCETDEGDTGS